MGRLATHLLCLLGALGAATANSATGALSHHHGGHPLGHNLDAILSEDGSHAQEAASRRPTPASTTGCDNLFRRQRSVGG